MDKKAANREQTKFAAWLTSEMAAQGMNQREFAAALGVASSTVNRWLRSRLPAAQYCELIADVLLLDVDEVLTRAGYRPADGRALKDEDRAKLLSMVRRVRLDRSRRGTLHAVLESMLKEDRETRLAQRTESLTAG